MSRLPLECVVHIVQCVETPSELFRVMRVNRVFFSTVARHLWYDPIGTVAKTRNPATSLHRLICLIFAISPSEDKDVVKVRRLFEWAAGRSNCFGKEWVSYPYDHVDILREPLIYTTPPLLDYLSFIGIFDLFAFKNFHAVVGGTICIMLSSKMPYHTGEETQGDADCDEDEIRQEEVPTLEDLLSTTELFENSLVTAACGHRLSTLKRISVNYSHLDQYLENPPFSSSPAPLLFKLASIQEMVWDISPVNGTSARNTAFEERILSLVPLFLEKYRWLHTIEIKTKAVTWPFATVDWRPKELLKALPPLRAPRVLDESNLPRVLVRWRDTDLSQVQHLRLMGDHDLLEDIEIIREWLALQEEKEAGHVQQAAAADGVKVLSKCLAVLLQHLPSLRRLEWKTWDDATFAWVTQEQRQRLTAIPWTRLSDLTVHCPLRQVRQIMNDAAITFGNTLEKLTILVDNTVIEFSYQHNPMMRPVGSTLAIRIGQDWHVPLLSHLVMKAPFFTSLEIDPLFLANAVHLTHLELVGTSALKAPPQGWRARTQLIKLNAPFMRYLRLIGEPTWTFDPSSLASMAPHLEYLELCDQRGIASNGLDHEGWWCWETWDFPRLQELHLEGPSVAGYPWYKMADCPKLESVSLGTGGSPDMVVPWMDVVAAAAEGGSSVKNLLLKGMWQLQLPTLEALLRDLCPQLTTLTLRRCYGFYCKDLVSVMTRHRHPFCIDSNNPLDFTVGSLALDLGQDGGNRGTSESAERRRRIIFRGKIYFLPEELEAP
ncbi:hypothetical protein DFQ27_009043 [Actinomortierella ambigua]|uniref:F-box domain-containing protein n=1 Tax=Actinomortierella ambigua TaxID=1343610 RepID=A0A9P6TY47_9FUNG|nr:hypothetical protein DFQ27_009043 [Actinomortierella ambigua]